MSSSTQNGSYQLASLYVGDLAPEVTEDILFEKFSPFGSIQSIRVCRNRYTGNSLGYGYINFKQHSDAEMALDWMNFEQINGRPVRIMWSQRDPSLRKSGVGNIFIKNLDKSIDSRILLDTVSYFGNILSCKVAQDKKGNSKGYGFVHFDSEESATKFIYKMNGMLLNGKKVFVGKFVPRNERVANVADKRKKFTNVYVKNLDEEIDDERLRKEFAPFGTITSAKVMTDNSGRSKGFGFVCFSNPEEATKAIKGMNKRIIAKKPLYVAIAQKKDDRRVYLERQRGCRSDY